MNFNGDTFVFENEIRLKLSTNLDLDWSANFLGESAFQL